MSAPPVRSNHDHHRRSRPSYRNNGNNNNTGSKNCTITGGPVLVPSLGNVCTTNITSAELQAWATLAKTHPEEDDVIPINKARPRRQRSGGFRNDAPRAAINNRISSDEIDAATRNNNTNNSRSTGSTPARARPSSAKVPQRVDALFENLRNLGPAATSTPTTSGLRRQKEGGFTTTYSYV